jgi:hypothetical protein
MAPELGKRAKYGELLPGKKVTTVAPRSKSPSLTLKANLAKCLVP